MAHKNQDTASSVGLENSIRQSWSAGSKVKILSSQSNDWVIAHIVTIHKDWLYCLLDDGDTKKIDRWDASVQPVGTNDIVGDGEDDDDLFWMKDSFGTTASGANEMTSNQSMSLGFSTLSNKITDDFSSSAIAKNNALSPRTIAKERESQALKNEQQKMCGYTIWVQWCDSSELHGYYQCVGLRNNRFHFKHRRDSLAELFADDKGYWYLMYDSQCLYKSKRKGHDDPPPRQWKCIEGSLPPPGVSQVALPDTDTPMVVIDEEKKINNNIHNHNNTFGHLDDDDDESDNMSQISGVSRMTTVKHTTGYSRKGLQAPKTSSKHSKKKSKSKKSKKSKKNKLNLAKILMDEFDVAIDVFDFNFDGSKQVAFHLNIARHMEVTKCKPGGQAETLGVLQGDILLKINEDDVSKNWEKATNLLRSFVSNKQQFTITFVRRKVENLMISVVRAGNSEFNGKYKFLKRDPDDDMCPIYVKNDHDDDFDFSDSDIKQEINDPLNSNSDSIHIIQRVYSNPDNFEALWVLKNGRDEHYYMCVTNEYLPPQHGWELVPESAATYPAPGLQFTSSKSTFEHVDRLRGYTNKQHPDDDHPDEKHHLQIDKDQIHHDALNINNRNRTNKHRHEKTLTRMRATLGSTNEFNNNITNNTRSISHTGGIGIGIGIAYGKNKMGGKKGGFGSRLFGGKKKSKIKTTSVTRHNNGNESAPETDEDTAKIEAIWKQKLEQTTKNAINQLTTQHQEEISHKNKTVDDLKDVCDTLRQSFAENSEYYYQLYLEKCELSLILQEKQIEFKKSKDKQKEMGKRYFSQQQRTEELELKLSDISSSFSSRMSAIQQKTGKHRATKSTVSDLVSIEQQFRNLLHTENNSKNKSKNKSRSPTKLQQSNSNDATNEYLENEIIKLNEKLNTNQEELLLMKQENKKLKSENKSLQNQLLSKEKGSDEFYTGRVNKLTHKVSLFQQNIYNLMSLLQNVEQEYMQKCGKLPKVTKAIDWRNEYDPKKYKRQIVDANNANNGQHPNNQTFVQHPEIAKNKNNKKKKKKHKNRDKTSATESMTLPHDQRWAGFNLGGPADEHENNQKPRHRGNKNNESRIIDL